MFRKVAVRNLLEICSCFALTTVAKFIRLWLRPCRAMSDSWRWYSNVYRLFL